LALRRTLNLSSTILNNHVLFVTAPPQILEDFQPNTIIAEEGGTRFRCTAQGYPAPTISWEHAGRRVVNGDNPNFKVNSTERNGGFIVTVTSFLTLSSADDSVNGEVRCIARPPPPDMVGGKQLDSDDTSTQLSVLGMYIQRYLKISRG
jgi:hypothetical protein